MERPVNGGTDGIYDGRIKAKEIMDGNDLDHLAAITDKEVAEEVGRGENDRIDALEKAKMGDLSKLSGFDRQEVIDKAATMNREELIASIDQMIAEIKDSPADTEELAKIAADRTKYSQNNLNYYKAREKAKEYFDEKLEQAEAIKDNQIEE